MDGIAIELALVFSLLGSPDWHTREAVTIPPHVAILGIYHPDPEIAHRCERALRLHAYAWADQAVANLKPAGGWPWCDGARGVHWHQFMPLAQEMTPADKQAADGGWHEYKTCTELWLRHELLAGTPVGQLRELLAEMVAAEERWLKANRPAEVLPAPQPGP